MVSKAESNDLRQIRHSYMVKIFDLLNFNSIDLDAALSDYHQDGDNFTLETAASKCDVEYFEKIIGLFDHIFRSIALSGQYLNEPNGNKKKNEYQYDDFEDKLVFFSNLIDDIVHETIDFHLLKRRKILEVNSFDIRDYYSSLIDFLRDCIVIVKQAMRRLKAKYLTPLQSQLESKDTFRRTADFMYNEEEIYYANIHVETTLAYQKVWERQSENIANIERVYIEEINNLRSISITKPLISDIVSALGNYLKKESNSYKIVGPYAIGQDFVIGNLRLTSQKITLMIEEIYNLYKKDSDKGYIAIRAYLYLNEEETLISAAEELKLGHFEDKARRSSRCVLEVLASQIHELINSN